MLQTNIFANPMNQNYEEFLEVSQFPKAINETNFSNPYMG